MRARTPPVARRWGIPILVAIAIVVATAALADTPYELRLPRGFPAPKIPADNPLTHEKVELERFLFYDTRLSGNETYACASCHQQEGVHRRTRAGCRIDRRAPSP